MFVIHGFSLLASCALIYGLIFAHDYRFEYVYEHASNELTWKYLVSCFWEGQEGSFLLWSFWTVILIYVMVFSNNHVYHRAVFVLSTIQFCLLTMVVGIPLPSIDSSIGMSPFLMRDVAMITDNGQGLNPLLQNPWMVIHPPVIFLSFAISSVPFALYVGNSRRKSKEWLSFVYPFSLGALLCLTVGITMGAYWAYETLNFGGYWSWDPVENAIYVPWLLAIATVHLVLIFKKKTQINWYVPVFISFSYLLILYATFLTRSGILGNSSVHAFTENGLSGQLIIFLIIGCVLMAHGLINSRKEVRAKESEDWKFNQAKSWIYIGAVFFALAAFQVLLPTSFPVLNALKSIFGDAGTLAPPTDVLPFYNDAQSWFSIGIVIFAVVAQFVFYKRREERGVLIVIAAGCSTILITWLIHRTFSFSHFRESLLLVSALFGLFTAFFLVLNNVKKAAVASSGIVSHVGVYLLLIGILISGTQQTITSTNRSMKNKTLSSSENLLLVRDEPTKLNQQVLTYSGSLVYLKEQNSFIPNEILSATQNEDEWIVTSEYQGAFHQGDTVHPDMNNRHFRIEVERDGDRQIIYPKVQMNPALGAVFSPWLEHHLWSDDYTHITNIPDTKTIDEDQAPTTLLDLHVGEVYLENDRGIVLKAVEEIEGFPGLNVNPNTDRLLQATLQLVDKEGVHVAKTMLLQTPTGTREVNSQPTKSGYTFTLIERGALVDSYKIGMRRLPKDWVTIRSIHFPMIGLVWVGAILIALGTLMAMVFALRTSTVVHSVLRVVFSRNRPSVGDVVIDSTGRLIGDLEVKVHRNKRS